MHSSWAAKLEKKRWNEGPGIAHIWQLCQNLALSTEVNHAGKGHVSHIKIKAEDDWVF